MEGPRLLSKMQGLSANQSEQRRRGTSPKGGLSPNWQWLGPQETRGWDPARLAFQSPFQQVCGEQHCTRLQLRETACSTHAPPPRGGVLLKGQRQRQWCQLHQDLPPAGNAGCTPPFVCIWEELLGNPMLGGDGGVVQAPHSGTGSDMQHISLGPIPALPVRLILGVQPGPPRAPSGRYGGG